MISDKIEVFHGALIHYGPLNDRIYLMKIGDAVPENIAILLKEKAQQHCYSKIFAKIPTKTCDAFLNVGFEIEAKVPKLYLGVEDAVFLGYYLTEERRNEIRIAEFENVLSLAKRKQVSPEAVTLPQLDSRFCLRKCREKDAQAMAELYRKVFLSYPYPIHDPSYIRKTMNSHVEYFGVEVDDRLIALSSADKDTANGNAEMTDFAILPEWRGYGLAKHLLVKMEVSIQRQSIHAAYTIARATSAAMNITFARSGYQYAGRLANNANISGGIESMNVWYKSIQRIS